MWPEGPAGVDNGHMTVADQSGDGRSGGGGDHLRGIVDDRAVNVEKK